MNSNKFIKENLRKVLIEQVQEVSFKQTSDLLNGFGFLITMGFQKIQSYAKDEASRVELESMQKNLRQPIINGKNFASIVGTPEFFKDRNPKLIQAILSKVREFILYIEPRIQRFVKDCPEKQGWLDKISKHKETYKQIVSQ